MLRDSWGCRWGQYLLRVATSRMCVCNAATLTVPLFLCFSLCLPHSVSISSSWRLWPSGDADVLILGDAGVEFVPTTKSNRAIALHTNINNPSDWKCIFTIVMGTLFAHIQLEIDTPRLFLIKLIKQPSTVIRNPKSISQHPEESSSATNTDSLPVQLDQSAFKESTRIWHRLKESSTAENEDLQSVQSSTIQQQHWDSLILQINPSEGIGQYVPEFH